MNQMKLTVKPSEAKPIIKFAIEKGFNLMLVGPPGCGKTYMVNQVCKELQADLEVFYASTMDPTYITGYPFPKKTADGETNEADFLLYGQMKKLMTATRLTVGFWDDFGQASKAVQSSAMNPLQVKIVNGQKLPDCVRWIIATNSKEHGANVQGILEPIKSRMHIILHIVPDLDDFLAYWLAESLPVPIYVYLRNNPSRLFDFKPSQDILPYPCPRAWENAGRMMAEDPDDNILMFLLAGAVGEADAMGVLQTMEMMKKMVDPELPLKDPNNAPIPDETTVLLGLIGAMIYRTTKKNVKNLLTYARRLPIEFAGKLRIDAISKSKKDNLDIENTAEYGELIRYTGNILMA